MLISSHILGELEKIATHYGIIRQGKLIQEISSRDMESRSRVFVSVRTSNLRGAEEILRKKFGSIKREEETLRIYDVEDTEAIVQCLLENGLSVSELKKNKIGLEEYYIELMSKKEVE